MLDQVDGQLPEYVMFDKEDLKLYDLQDITGNPIFSHINEKKQPILLTINQIIHKAMCAEQLKFSVFHLSMLVELTKLHIKRLKKEEKRVKNSTKSLREDYFLF